ncbi:hypothetical protein FP828_05825 [bacterium]|nr:hypothetical protein [bacterium]
MKKDGGAGIKALLTLSDGVTFLEAIYRKMAEFSEKVIIVLGADKDEILTRLKFAGKPGRMVRQMGRAEIVYNENYKNGMFSSLKKALPLMPAGNAFMINPVDCPAVKKETYKGLLAKWGKYPDKIHIPSFDGRRGHPAIYPSSLVREILDAPDNLPGGLKFFLKRDKENILYFDTNDKGVIMDVDTPADYEKITGVRSVIKK